MLRNGLGEAHARSVTVCERLENGQKTLVKVWGLETARTSLDFEIQRSF